MKIIPLSAEYLEATRKFADQVIGKDYYSAQQLEAILERTQVDGVCCSFLLIDKADEVKGFRLTYPPGNWLDLKNPDSVHPELWEEDPVAVAYFQSIFLSDEVTGKGWGRKLSQASVDALKRMGAKAIVCHSWKESPHNSSRKYLEKMGFKALRDIPNFWIQVDYECVRCGKPCLCTATEMVFKL